jgi:hypothetical protein
MYNWSQIYIFQQLSGNTPSLSAGDHWFDHTFFMFLYIFCFAKRYVTKFRLLLRYAKQYETKFRLIFRFATRNKISITFLLRETLQKEILHAFYFAKQVKFCEITSFRTVSLFRLIKF